MIHPCRYFLYAQGVPLLIIMITAITDEVGQDWLEENRHSSYSVPIITRSGINKSEGYRGEVFCNTTVFSDQPGENDTLSKERKFLRGLLLHHSWLKVNKATLYTHVVVVGENIIEIKIVHNQV